jgi:Zn-dependent oligopeptidase
MLEMFKTFEHLFGTRIQSFTASAEEVWHDNVSLYTVWDSDNNNSFLGWLYIDQYPRDGKYAHFGHYGLQQVCQLIRSTLQQQK